jgi:methyl-accepting chemotaxis protein
VSFFSNISIRNKVVLAFAVVLLFTAGIGVFAVISVRTVNSSGATVVDSINTGDGPLGIMAKDGEQMVALAAAGAAQSDPAAAEGYYGKIAAVQQEYDAQWSKYAPTMDAGQETIDGNSQYESFGKISAALAQMESFSTARNATAARTLLNGLVQVELANLTAKIGDDLAYQNAENDSLAAAARQTTSSATFWISVILGVMAIATICVAWLIIKGVSVPIKLMTQVMDKLSRGNLDVEISGAARRDEIGVMSASMERMCANLRATAAVADQIANGDLSVQPKPLSDKDTLGFAMERMVANLRATATVTDQIANGDLTVQPKPMSDKDTLGLALQRMVERLRGVVGNALSASENVSSGSQQLSSTAGQVSEGASEQAAAAEQASASMEQMAANIKQNADNATQTEKISRQSAKDAELSGEAVNRAVAAMQTIAKKNHGGAGNRAPDRFAGAECGG